MKVNRQSKLIFLSWMVYASAYIGRYSYNSNIIAIEDSFGLSHAETGLVATVFFFIYGAGQFINGMLCKKYKKKYTIPAALLISSAVNMLIFTNIPFAYVKYLWAINAAAQSTLWSSLMCALGENLDNRYIEKSVVIMSTPTAFGTFAVYGCSALFAIFGGYRYTFLIASVIMTAVAVFWFFSYDKITEKQDELLTPEHIDNSILSSDTNNKTHNKKGVSILILGIAELAVFSICDNLIKDGLSTWVPSILKEEYGLNDSLSIALSLALPILGLFGALFVSLLNKITKKYVLLSGGLFLCSAILILSILGLLSSSLWFITLVLFGVTALLMHGINNIITCLCPLNMRSQINSGVLAGILNGFAYVGSTLSTYSLGVLADKSGWNSVIRFLFYVCLFPVAISTVKLILDIIKKFYERKIKQ